MRLTKLKFVELEGLELQWTLEEMTFGYINLIVGKNASGKSRILNVISGLANIIRSSGPVALTSAHYLLDLEHQGRPWTYELVVRDTKIVVEKLTRGGEILLERGAGGVGRIRYEKENGELLEFQTPENHLAVTSRQDSIQHPFLQDLITWASEVYHYQFAGALGKDSWAIMRPGVPLPSDLRDTSQVIAIFLDGQARFPGRFETAIVSDMASVGYELSEIGITPPLSVVLQGPIVDSKVMYVKEKELPGRTDQVNMSLGMWRALSILIQLNYGILAENRRLLLIDDIGEGLDFERSVNLIRLIVAHAEKSAIQLLMTSNDRFVMNTVPLFYWQVLDRIGATVRAYNAENSEEAFNAFKFSGLSNFDFFARDFLKLEEG